MSCRSTSIATAGSTGVTVSWSPRALASIAAASSTSSMSSVSGTSSLAMEPRFEPHFGQRTVDEVAQRDQVAAEDAARAAADADCPALQDLEGEHRIPQQVPELVGEEAQALGSAVR